MFIVLKLHRQSLRQMMKQGRVNHSIKIQVLQILKEWLSVDDLHCDIKDFYVFHNAVTVVDRDLKNQRNSRKTF